MKFRFFHLLKSKIKAHDDSYNFTCDVCGREVFDNARVCAVCRRTLPWNNKVICPVCGRRQKEEGLCLQCKAVPLGIVKARSVFVHEGEAKGLVARYKNGSKYLFRALAELSLPLATREFSDVDAIIGVPMSAKARKKRGYNQAELYADRMGELLGKEVLRPVQKRKETSAQKFLSRKEREKNLEGVFHVSERKQVKGKRILLVDDTLTTGATISTLGGALKRAGAAEIYALTFTSVENKNPYGKPPNVKN